MISNQLKLWFVPLLAVVVLSVASCGGGGSPPTKAAFIKEADAICRKADEAQQSDYASYVKQSPDLSTKAGEEKLYREVLLPPIQAEAEELDALTTPAGDEKEIKEIVAELEEAVRKSDEDPDSIEGGPTTPFDQVNRMTQRYGFKDCAEPA